MIIGVPKEIKDNEYRVALTPAGVEVLTAAGHRVLMEKDAGQGSGFPDQEYVEVGGEVVSGHEDIFEQAEIVMKVKEPVPAEYPMLRKGLVLFTYFHLAASEELTRAVLESEITAIAYETVQLPDGTLPLLIPMSRVAGRMSVQIGAQYLEKMNGGRGKLLGGVPGVPPCNVTIVGGGTVGTSAAQIALGMGAQVTIVDIEVERLRYLTEILHGNLITRVSHPRNIALASAEADLVIGAVLIPGAKAPKLVTRRMVSNMKQGAVIVDVAVDQGGCLETSRPTTHSEPTYVIDGVVHYCVSNMPGAVPRTSTYALSNATLPYALKLANLGFSEAIRQDEVLAKGVNAHGGAITHQGVADTFGLPCRELNSLI